MIFICDRSKMSILIQVARDIGLDDPTMSYHVNLSDDRLITIARVLGMEELHPAISNEEAMERLGLVLDPVPENSEKMPVCEICGKPVKTKRQRVCSDECRAEKQQRYQREYRMRKAKEANSETVNPLAVWGSNPGDEPVRAGGLE